MDSAKVYISVDDFTHSSYPTFVGQTGNAILPADIIGEAHIENATVGTTTIVGDHLVTGFPYSSRVYFGPVTVERLRIRVLGADGTPVDTRGVPFSLVPELEQLYNVSGLLSFSDYGLIPEVLQRSDRAPPPPTPWLWFCNDSNWVAPDPTHFR